MDNYFAIFLTLICVGVDPKGPKFDRSLINPITKTYSLFSLIQMTSSNMGI